jgi:thymidylate synthase ThyX
MSYDAKILADSISPEDVRLTTMQITFPRFELPAFNTHRVFARNSASSRAIPVEKQIQRVLTDPYIPESFGKNQRGMQSDQEILDQDGARQDWLLARDSAVFHARAQMKRETHKQIANRLLEPFMMHTVIVTATDWRNFFALRLYKDAQPEIRKVAGMMREVMDASEPNQKSQDALDHGYLTAGAGLWHLPLVYDQDLDQILRSADDHAGWLTLARLSAARCARVSYLTHDGKRDIDADLALADRLLTSGHMSPFEHAARPAAEADWREQLDRIGVTQCTSDGYDDTEVDLTKFTFGNLRGWVSLRWTMPGEAVFGGGDP